MRGKAILILAAALASAPLLFAQSIGDVRNIQILVDIRTDGAVRQGAYESLSRSAETQFLTVTDGFEGRIFVGKRVPNIVWYRDFLRNEGHLTGEIVLRDVGTSLVVTPRIVGGRIEITLTPEISYETGDSRETVAVHRLTTTVRLADGETMQVGGGVRRTEFEDRFYRRETGEAVRIFLTPHIL